MRGQERLNYEEARRLLVLLFEQSEADYGEGRPPEIPPALVAAAEVLFASPTQSYREALLGCGLARLLDRSINIRHPYISHGSDAFNGRTLDEQVVNPFLHDRMIPASKGPYLATFRRSVRFVPDTAQGLRDKKGYEAFLDYLSAFEQATSDEDIAILLRYLLYRFAALRDASNIPLARIVRLSLDQYEHLVDGLLNIPSGGLLPVLLTVAMFNTIRRCFNLDWEVGWQGINVADRASGASGDITIRQGNRSTTNVPGADVRTVAMQYFAQGHDVSFLQVKPWLVNSLGTLGARCRTIFTTEFLALMDNPGVSAVLKVGWNDLIKTLLG
jgi:hypothetical protein